MDEVPEQLFFVSSNNTWLESFSAPEATNIRNLAFYNCVALTKLTLGGTSVTVVSEAFDYLNTNQVDLYLSAEEYNTVTGANHNEWESRVWKSITKIDK